MAASGRRKMMIAGVAKPLRVRYRVMVKKTARRGQTFSVMKAEQSSDSEFILEPLELLLAYTFYILKFLYRRE